MLFRDVSEQLSMQYAASPFDRAYGLVCLYFVSELGKVWNAPAEPRDTYVDAIDDAAVKRVRAAMAKNVNVTDIDVPQSTADAVIELGHKYRQTVLDCLSVAYEIAQETIPKESQMTKAWTAAPEKVTEWLKCT